MLHDREEDAAGFLAEINIPPAHRKCCSLSISATLVYPVLPGLYMTLYWTGGWVRNKNQTGLGDVRTTLPSCTTEERNALTGRTKSDKLPSGSPR